MTNILRHRIQLLSGMLKIIKSGAVQVTPFQVDCIANLAKNEIANLTTKGK